MKKFIPLLLSLTTIFYLLSVSSCSSSKSTNSPFDSIEESNKSTRDKIVIISDLHLGNDLSYSENVKHLGRLTEFLKEIRSSETVKELVIGGDMLDEWYIPTRTDTYGGGTQADFVKKTVAANKEVFDVINGIIADGKVKVTYVPGNHDMGFTPENIDLAMPGINQARDAANKTEVGTYHPEGYPQIAIEHSHRYDFFSSMCPNANDADAKGAILPPGYFFARIAANSFTDPTTPEAATKVPEAKLYDSTNVEQKTKYIYYTLWNKVLTGLIFVKDDFNEPIITTNIGNYTKTYSINDLLPKNDPKNKSLIMNLYNGIFTQKNWEERLAFNNASIMTPIDSAIIGSLATSFIDNQSQTQYFNNKASEQRVVVFGHTHIPMIKTFTNTKGQECIYANSGTWEDKKSRDKNAAIDQDAENMDFIVIYPAASNKNKVQVAQYQYLHGKHELKDSKSIEL